MCFDGVLGKIAWLLSDLKMRSLKILQAETFLLQKYHVTIRYCSLSRIQCWYF